MKKLVLIVAVLMLLVVTGQADAIEMNVGGKVDAPNLVRLTKNITVGVEASKGVLNDVFSESRYWVEDDLDFEGYVKLTYTGTWFSFAKK